MGISGEVVRTAAEQGGHVTRTQLLKLGLSASAIDRRLRSGDLMNVKSAVYRIYNVEEHIDLVRGALLTLPDAVVSHESAAHLFGFPNPPVLRPTVTVPSHTTHLFPGVIVRRCNDLVDEDRWPFDDLLVTSPARTVFDLAGVIGFKEFDRIAEALILKDLMTLYDFEQITTKLARRGKPGSRAARDFIGARAGGHRRASSLERKGRSLLKDAGLPDPVSEYPIPWAPSRRFDDAYPTQRLAIEWDSRSWHLQREAMAKDRRRDREAAVRGWLVVRITWQDLDERPGEVAATVAKLLENRNR